MARHSPSGRPLLVFLLAAASALLVAGCSDDGGGGVGGERGDDGGGEGGDTTETSSTSTTGGGANPETNPEASGSTEGLPDWWPATLPLPDGFALDSAAQDQGTGAVLDLTGTIDGMDAATAADVFEESAQANGWTLVDRVNVPLQVTYSGPDATVTVGFSDIEGGAAVVATVDPASTGNTDGLALPGPIDPGAADGPGVAVVTVDGARHEGEGECTGFTFRDFDGMADGVLIEVLTRLDASGTTIEFSGAGFTTPDGTSWNMPATPVGDIDRAPDIETRASGYFVGGQALNISAGDGSVAAASIEVTCG